LEKFVRDLAGYAVGRDDLIEMVFLVAGIDARCAWITDRGSPCTRGGGFFRHPAFPEGRLRLCTHHATTLHSHLQAFESEGITALKQQRLRMREWAHDRPERMRRLQDAMDKAAMVCGDSEGGAAVVTYAMARERWVKIGRTFNVAARYRSLLSGGAAMPPEMRHSAPLTLLFTIPGDCEQVLHREFHELRERGTEWFRHEGSVAEWTADVLRAQAADGTDEDESESV
jgi:hypothetical protein